MSGKPVAFARQAELDVEAIVDRWTDEGQAPAALAFIDALDRAYAHIGRFPEAGSGRIGHLLDLPALRSWKVAGYPFLVFYVDEGAQLVVQRVLDGRRDVLRLLEEPLGG